MKTYHEAQQKFLSERAEAAKQSHLQTAVKSLVSAMALAKDTNKLFDLQLELAHLAKDVTSIMVRGRKREKEIKR
jgi:hypothetical protein